LRKPVIYGRIILKCVLKELGVRICTDLYGSRQNPVTGFYENCNENRDSLVGVGGGGNFLKSEVSVGFSRRRLLHGVSWG
jgi:hypothetical protein